MSGNCTSMADLILVLEASAGSGSLALLRGDDVVAEAGVPMRGHDGERLMPALVQLLRETGAATHDLQRIVCGGGPGGFTSLRIAAAIAKGLAESLGVELWAVSSLALLAAGERGELGEAWHARGAVMAEDAAGHQVPARRRDVLAVLDALRGEWYSQRFGFGPDGTVMAVDAPVLRDRESLEAEAASRGGARIVGVGGDSFDGGRVATPLARHVSRLPKGPLLHPVDLARWEPDYGRLAEAQVKWEKAHGRPLGAVG